MKTCRAIHHDLRTLFDAGAMGRLSDGELLELFISRRDGPAFEAIVRRHGPMVLGVCRRVLRDHHDAEDAFQATFMVLARRAGSVRPREKLPNWLHGVAHNTAIKARALNARRRSRERHVTTMPDLETRPAETGDDLAGCLDRELRRLPEEYRLPIILCELEGLGHREAALKLGWPVGTVSGRLSRARAMLAVRLTRRGLALPVGALAMAPRPGSASAGVPAFLFRRTIETAIPSAAGPVMAAGAISGPVAGLTNRIIGGMMMSRLIATVGAVLAGGMLVSGGIAGQRVLARPGARGVLRPAARPAFEDPASREAKLLQGTWQGAEIVVNGKKASISEARDLLMTFEGEEILMRSVNGPGRGRRSRYKLYPGQTPRAIDLIPVEGDERGQTSAGIYELEKDRLKICTPSNVTGKEAVRRPSGFRTKGGDGLVLFVLERVGPNGPVDPGPRDASLAAFEVIDRDYQRAEHAYQDEMFRPRTADERGKAQAKKRPDTDRFAGRFLELARARPGTREALFSLCWAVVNAPAGEPGKQALALLEDGRLAGSSPGDLLQALEVARTSQEALPSPLIPIVLRTAEGQLDHPAAAGLLTWVCRNHYASEWPEEPRFFAEAANLIATQFADRPGIQNFCECLGSVSGHSPAWAGKYERHLRTILDRNRDRLVLCMAHYALATVLKNADAARHDEAEKLYESFIKRFEDHPDPATKGLESQMIEMAKQEIKRIRDRRKDRPAPAPKPER